MSGVYVGTLDPGDPLHPVLSCDVLQGVLGYRARDPVYDVFQLDGAGTVYRYDERGTFVQVVGKFFGRKWLNGGRDGDPELRRARLRGEFESLRRARAMGLDTYPHTAVRPLLANPAVGCVLVEEVARGMDLDHYIRRAVKEGHAQELRDRLADVASFIADLHTRSRTAEPVEVTAALARLEHQVRQLARWEVIGPEQRARLEALRDRWAASGALETGTQVMVHGDCSPLHFLHDGPHGITAIDFERSHMGDPALDLGCMAAELRHLCWWYSHDRGAGEPFIRHLYDAYAAFLPPGAEDFGRLTARGRFFMAVYELRSGRNSWLEHGYRHALIHEAEACLQI